MTGVHPAFVTLALLASPLVQTPAPPTPEDLSGSSCHIAGVWGAVSVLLRTVCPLYPSLLLASRRRGV